MIAEQLFKPKSIVVVGASNDITKPGGKVVKHIVDGKFQGPVYTVNPKEDTIQGLPCYRNVHELPQVDLAVIAVAAKYAPEAVEVLTQEKGTRAVIVISAGFGEEGPEGKALEKRLLDACNAVGAALIGPNCTGVLTPWHHSIFSGPMPELDPHGCDFITGSGATGVFILEAAIPAGLRFASVFAVGNSAQLGVEEILEHMDEPPFDSIHVHLNTNGLLPASQALMKHPRWDSISVSLHHYERAKLSELYGVHIPDTAISFEGVNPMKVNASCNLIKGYIDSTAEARRMMDFCLDHDFTRLGFVGLMPVNDYCRQHLVELDELHLEEIPHCYFTESQHRGKDCRCSNYLYNKHLKVLDIYMRHYVNPSYCESSLLFDGEYLRQGFYEDNIIY